MNPEEVKKLIAALKAEGLAEADAIKLVTDAVDAANRGLIQKRDELLAQEKALKEKITGYENAATEHAKKMAEVEAQLKKSNPEEYKKYYEGQAKELTDKHAAALATLTQERDRFRDSHYARLRDDAVNTGIKDINFIDGLKDGFIALAMLKNQFKPTEIDGKIIFTNQDNKTIEACLHELSLSKEGKAYIKHGNQGGGSGGTPGQSGQQGSPAGSSLSREQFAALSDNAKMEFVNKGGQVTAA